MHGIRLRENINAAGKQVVLIAPTPGAKPGSGANDDIRLEGLIGIAFLYTSYALSRSSRCGG